MSLYTPVFPPTDQRPLEASQSSSLSSTSTATRKLQGVSYSSRLSQWHLSIAALPEELCPASEPSSPTSQERSKKLKSTIEEAVREGRYAGDLCKLRSTKFGYATRQPATSYADEADIPYILAGTEEEWFAWEKKVAERRVSSKGKERERFMPPKCKALSSRDKVMGWKAGLEVPSDSVIDAPLQSNETRQTKIAFPVVKRASLLKTAKSNMSVSSVPVTKSKDTNSASPPRSSIANSDNEMEKCDIALGDQILTNSLVSDRTSNNGRSPNKEDMDKMIVEIEQGKIPQSFDVSTCPPPSFPSHLPTSTPKGNVAPTIDLAQQDGLELRPQTNFPTISETTEELNRPFQHHPNNATPPSPPPSLHDSSIPTSNHVQRAASVIPATVQPPLILAEGRQERPLTPPEDNNPITAITQNVLRTPDKHSLKKYRSMPASRISASGPSTPLSFINGVGVVGIQGVPTTPDQHVVPDLLATSRKSIPRPRPPSRKEKQRECVGLDIASEAGDPTPARSERSYFSSPASGDSSGSIRTAHLPGSPSSPLNFTQNPGKFAPVGESTQASSHAHVHESPSNLEFTSSRAQLNSSQHVNIGGGLHRASSGLMGMVYNSQFDLESRVNEVSNFMEKDVDFGAWVRDEDEEEEEIVRVELTVKAP